jgi:hypothetical protein
LPGYEEETKLFDIAWESKENTCTFPANMCSAMVEIRDIINNCNDALTRSGLSAISYSGDAGYQELVRITNNILNLNNYVKNVRADLGSAIDDPLFYAFNQKGKATELLSLIHMEDFQTENTVNVGGIVALGGNIATTTKPTIGFSDFIGTGGEANEAALVTQKVCVQEFNDLFARVYELDRESGNLTANGVKSLKDYQNLLLTDTDFDHKKEQPLLEALSGLVDFLIIPEFFKAAIGYDPITDEFLTDQERQNLVIDGCVQTALLGAGIGTGLVASAAEKAAAKAAAVEAGAVAGDEVLIKSGSVMGDAVAGDGLLIGEEGAAKGVLKTEIELLNESTCSSDELYNYLLKNTDSDAANIFLENGAWPKGVQIPKNSSVLNADGSLNWSKAAEGGYKLNPDGTAIKTEFVPKVGEIIDRYGNANGRYASPVIDGESYAYTERSLPYVEDLSNYHRYKVAGDFTRIEEYISSCSDAKLKAQIEAMVTKYYDGDYSKLVSYEGEIAKVDGWGTGGAVQNEYPLTIDKLEKLGLLKEIE